MSGRAKLSRRMRYALEKVVQGERVFADRGGVFVNGTPAGVMPIPFTRATLQALEARGLVTCSLPFPQWHPTEEGRRVIAVQSGKAAP